MSTHTEFLIETERLQLRPHALSDVPFMMALNADPLVVQYTGDVAFTDPTIAEEVITSLQRQFTERRLGRLITLHRDTGEALGWCGLRWHEDEQGVDLGFRFFRKYWGLGYATEASVACLAWLRENTDIRHVFARAMPENIGSVRVLEKLGFTTAGTRDDEGFLYFTPASR